MNPLKHISLLAIFCCLSMPVLAETSSENSESSLKTESEMPGTLTGGVSFNSDYVYRGISQTANGAAVMGNVDWAFETGVNGTSGYIGAFGANVDFPGTNANLETDLIAGIRGESRGIEWDAGLAYFMYHGDTSSLNLDYYEFTAKASHDFGFASLLGQASYSPEFSGKTGSAYYLSGRIEKQLPYEFSGFASVGHQWIDDNALADLPDYYDWSVGVSRQVWKFNVSATYTDTNLSKDSCYSRSYGNVCGAKAVLGVGIEF